MTQQPPYHANQRPDEGRKRKICLIYAGGTLTGRRIKDPKTEREFIVQPQNKLQLLDSLPELKSFQEYGPLSGIEHPADLSEEDVVFFKAIDSTNVTPQDWLELARVIVRLHKKYEGFVIIHGTDTMVYTAAALGLLLQHLNKPVVLTGSQLPLQGELVTDARNNLLNACRVAAQDIGEVVICFGNVVVRGCRPRKISESEWQCFTSTETPPIATIGVTLNLDSTVAFPRGPTTLTQVDTTQWEHNVCVVKLSPGMRPNTLEAILTSGVKGVVIEGFGAGNIPDEAAGAFNYVEVIRDAIHRGIAIVLCGQTPIGRGEIFHNTDNQYFEAGMINGYDMTPEAAVVKLMWVLGHTTILQDVKARMQNAFIGEINGSRSVGGT